MTAASEDREAGFALVMALVAAMLFAFFAYTILAADRGATASLDAQLHRARLEAAADGAIATAVEGLSAKGSQRWSISAGPQTFTLDDVEITAAVEDERGKVNLNALKPDQARRLMQSAGFAGPRLDAVTDSLLNWEDGAERPDGARIMDYAADGVRLRRGPIRTVGELMAIKGMDLESLDRVAPALTVFFGNFAPFDATTASPLAMRIMYRAGGDGPDAINRARAQAGQHTALGDDTPADDYVGRPFTIWITARGAGGDLLRRATVVELTGQPTHPFWTRAIDEGFQSPAP